MFHGYHSLSSIVRLRIGCLQIEIDDGVLQLLVGVVQDPAEGWVAGALVERRHHDACLLEGRHGHVDPRDR